MPKRTPKGIFGLPSHNMLFSFTTRAGDEWPDDKDDDGDDDSDYEPGHDLKPMVEDMHVTRSSDSDVGAMSSEETTSRKRNKKAKKSKDNKKTKKEKPNKKKDNVKVTSYKRKSSKRNGKIEEGRSVIEGKSDVASRKDWTAVDDDKWGQQLPLIALEKILFFAVRQDGVVPILCRASKVCRLWREAARASSLWYDVALDNGRVRMTDETLQWLTSNRLPPQLKSINLNSCTKVTDKSFVPLVERSSHLQSISVEHCVKLTSNSIDVIRDYCRNLKQLDIGFTANSLTCSGSMKSLLRERGATIQDLQIAGCSIVGSSSLMSTITKFCPNLLILDLSNCHVTVECLMFPVEAMQKSCPLLQVLRLAGTRVQASNASAKLQRESEGFTELRELSLAVADDVAWQVVLPTNQGTSNDFLQRLLKNSPVLRLLDLRGCTLIRNLTLQELNTANLEHLYISRCPLTRDEAIDVTISKWSHSLVELDLSWNTYSGTCLDRVMRNLSFGRQLRRLDLSGTNVSLTGVRSILNGCSSLESLKLTSCRSLPRGFKRSYDGTSLRKLSKQLENIHGADGDCRADGDV